MYANPIFFHLLSHPDSLSIDPVLFFHDFAVRYLDRAQILNTVELCKIYSSVT